MHKMHQRIKMSNEICISAFEPVFGDRHSANMQHDIPKLLRIMIDRLRVKQDGLAKRLSSRGLRITQSNVSRWMNGTTPQTPYYARIIAVAEELGILSDVRSEDVAASIEPAPGPKSKLKGYIGAGSEAHFYALADEDFEEVPAPPGATNQTVALEIKGSSMGKAFDSWLVYYDDVRSPVTADQIGELCVVGLADDRVLLKRIELQRGGGYRLVPNNPDEEIIEDAQIEWAALATALTPKPRRG